MANELVRLEDAIAEVSAAIEAKERLLKDAARYRWARQHGAWDTECFLNGLTPEQYDAEIDKRIAEDVPLPQSRT